MEVKIIRIVSWITLLTIITMIVVYCQTIPTDKRTDIDKLTTFHKQLITSLDNIDSAYSKFTTDSEEAVNKLDMIALYESAQNLENEVNSVSSFIDAPSFDNDHVNNDVSQIKTNYLYYRLCCKNLVSLNLI